MIGEEQLERHKRFKARALSLRSVHSNGVRLMLALLWCFTLFGLLNPQLAGKAAADALVFCGMKLIPSLFPLAAAGSILAKAGIGRRLGALLGGALGMMGLSPASTVCLLMGLFTGFPTGAIIASTLVQSGQIDSEEASRLCCFTNNASAAFLVGTVGSGLFGDSRIGWLLWLAQTLAALTVGIVMGRRALKNRRQTATDREAPKAQEAPLDWSTVSRSIADSAQGMLSLAAFVVFFSVFTAFVGEGTDALLAQIGIESASPLIRTFVCGFFEISGGLRSASSLALPLYPKLVLAAVLTGWSGLSVFMQCLAAAKGLNASHAAALPRRLASAKAASTVLTAFYAAALAVLFVS